VGDVRGRCFEAEQCCYCIRESGRERECQTTPMSSPAPPWTITVKKLLPRSWCGRALGGSYPICREESLVASENEMWVGKAERVMGRGYWIVRWDLPLTSFCSPTRRNCTSQGKTSMSTSRIHRSRLDSVDPNRA